MLDNEAIYDLTRPLENGCHLYAVPGISSRYSVKLGAPLRKGVGNPAEALIGWSYSEAPMCAGRGVSRSERYTEHHSRPPTFRRMLPRSALMLMLLLGGDIERNPGPFRVAQWNANTLSHNKLAPLLAREYDIILVQEVNKARGDLKATGYNVYHNRRENRKGGGTAILLRRNSGIQFVEHQTVNGADVESSVVKLSVQGFQFCVVSAYFRPGGIFNAELQRLLSVVADTPCLLCGDFNLLHNSWTSMDSDQSPAATTFLNTVSSVGFALCNARNAYTREKGVEKSVLDLTFSRELTVDQWTTQVTPYSDHHIVCFELVLPIDEIRQTRANVKTYFRWTHADWDQYQQYIVDHLDKPDASLSVHQCNKHLCTVIRNAALLACPRGSLQQKDSPWPDDLRQIEADAIQAKSRYLRTLSLEDKALMDAKIARNKDAISLFLSKKYEKKINSLKPGEPMAWSFIGNCMKPSQPDVCDVLLQGTSHKPHSRKMAANVFAKCFMPAAPPQRAPKIGSALSSIPATGLRFFSSRSSSSSSFSTSSFFTPCSESVPSLSFYSCKSAAPVILKPTASRSLSSFKVRLSSIYNSLLFSNHLRARRPLFSSSLRLANKTLISTLGLSAFSHLLSWDNVAPNMIGFSTRSDQGSGTLQDPFTPAELENALYSLKRGKAPGPDEIYPELLQMLPPVGIQYLLYVCNTSWIAGELPSDWKSATVFPLLKDGKDPSLPSSYRPISLTSVVCKVMEKMIATRLKYVWNPSEFQFGFQRARQTTMPLAFLLDEVERNRNVFEKVWIPKASEPNKLQPTYRPYRTLAIMVDFKKAFDSISHRRLMLLLSTLPQSGRMYAWIRQFISNRHHRVKVGNDVSRARKLYRGVPQGSVLGPLLFVMYMDPLLKTLNNLYSVKATMFADDLTLIFKAKTKASAVESGNHILRLLTEWCADNEMEINPQKCEALWFTVSTHTDDDQSEQHLTVSGHSIPIVTLGASKPPKLLGVRLDSRMNFGPAVSSIVSQSATRLAQLKCIASRLAGPRPHEQRQFVMGYGVSQLMYGSDLIWATTFETAKVRLDKAYNSLVRNVCCLPPTTDADSALLEANMLPSYILMICYRAALFEKLYAQFDWSRRPPLLFTPTKNQTLKLISSCEWSQQLTVFFPSAGVIQRDPKHTL
ncbi:hypothetical protein AGDE_05358 [Angomonas deanei]|nr:hypothetical protein AGDE_05358 [Angomonas deanei]|eukprot:EPY38571.1 hypothetical protein AGDE_05358 [Angomonas deanei]